MNWTEKPNEELRNDLCRILKNSIDFDLDSYDIIDIHRIPSGHQYGSRPFRKQNQSYSKQVKVQLKKVVMMYDRLTLLNTILLRNQNNDTRIQ